MFVSRDGIGNVEYEGGSAMRDSTFLVTGATGHIGNVLIPELIARKKMVRALVMPNDDCRPLANLEVEIVRGDVTDLKSLESAFGGADIVFHLAGIVTIMPSMKKVLGRVNVGGVRNV